MFAPRNVELYWFYAQIIDVTHSSKWHDLRVFKISYATSIFHKTFLILLEPLIGNVSYMFLALYEFFHQLVYLILTSIFNKEVVWIIFSTSELGFKQP